MPNMSGQADLHSDDYYRVLGVDRNAADAEIGKAGLQGGGGVPGTGGTSFSSADADAIFRTFFGGGGMGGDAPGFAFMSGVPGGMGGMGRAGMGPMDNDMFDIG